MKGGIIMGWKLMNSQAVRHGSTLRFSTMAPRRVDIAIFALGIICLPAYTYSRGAALRLLYNELTGQGAAKRRGSGNPR